MTILLAALALNPTKANPGSTKTHPTAAQVSVTMAQIVDAFRPIALASAPAGSDIVAAMEDGSVRIIDAKTHQTVRQLLKHPQPVYALAWSPDGRTVASGDESGRVWIENAVTGKAVRGYRRHTKGVEKLSFNDDGNLLISTGKDDSVNVYNLEDPQPKEQRQILGNGRNFYGATFNPLSPRYFTVGMLDGGLREYDAESGEVAHSMSDPNGQGIFDVSYVPSGRFEVSAGRDGEAVIWDAKSFQRIGALKGHGDWVIAAASSPNSRLVATSSTDRTVKVWNMQTYQKVADLPEQFSIGSPLCFTADGNTLVTVSDMGYLQFNAITPAQPQLNELTPVAAAKHRRRSVDADTTQR